MNFDGAISPFKFQIPNAGPKPAAARAPNKKLKAP